MTAGNAAGAGNQIRLLLVDDHAVFRDAVRRLIESHAGLRVVGEASSVRIALEQVRKHRPDVILLDLNMPQESGLEFLRRVGDLKLDVKVILLAGTIEKRQIIEALRLGGRGVLLKDSSIELLVKSIRTVMAGEYWITHDCVSELVGIIRVKQEPPRAVPNEGRFGLTLREFEIACAVKDGCTNKDIATKYKISEQTVKHHLTRIFKKVGVASRLELAMFAMSRDLAMPEE